MPVSIGPGWLIQGGWTIGPGNYAGQTTQSFQNVAGSNGTVGFFFQGGSWATTPSPSYYDIQAGWTVVGLPGATVVSTDAPSQTVTITGGVFVSGSAYSFTGV
jgi:hypothetical protein